LRKFVWERKEDISGVVRERDAGKGENHVLERERERERERKPLWL